MSVVDGGLPDRAADSSGDFDQIREMTILVWGNRS